jgi:hypothetical protein
MWLMWREIVSWKGGDRLGWRGREGTAVAIPWKSCGGYGSQALADGQRPGCGSGCGGGLAGWLWARLWAGVGRHLLALTGRFCQRGVKAPLARRAVLEAPGWWSPPPPDWPVLVVAADRVEAAFEPRSPSNTRRSFRGDCRFHVESTATAIPRPKAMTCCFFSSLKTQSNPFGELLGIGWMVVSGDFTYETLSRPYDGMPNQASNNVRQVPGEDPAQNDPPTP